MSNQLTMKVGVAIFAALALVGALTMFVFGSVYPVEASGHSAMRSFDPATVAPGGTVTVTVSAENYGRFGRVTETLPAGFTYESSSLNDDEDVSTDGQNVKFTLFGDESFTYRVTAPMTEGEYTFSGMFRDSNQEDVAVGGDTMVTVSEIPPYTATGNESVSVSPTSADVGDAVTVRGSGFDAGASVVIVLDDMQVATATVLSDGSFVIAFIVGDTVTAGSKELAVKASAGAAEDLATAMLMVNPTLSLSPTSINNDVDNTVTAEVRGFMSGDVTFTAGDVALGSGSRSSVDLTIDAGELAAGTATIMATQGSLSAMAYLEVVTPAITLSDPPMDNSSAFGVTVMGTNFGPGTTATVTGAGATEDDIPITMGGFTGTITLPAGTEAGEVTITATSGEYDATASFMLTQAPPAQVMGVVVTPGEGSLAVNWTQVQAMAGAEVRPAATGYKVEWKMVSAAAWAADDMAMVAGSDQVYHLISGLTANVPYMVRVSAMAADTGYGMPSAISRNAVGTPRAVPVPAAEMVPGRVQNLSVTTIDNDSLSVSWDAPAMAANTPAISKYVVRYRGITEDSFGASMDADTSGSHVIDGLKGSTTYQVQVAAVNSVGTGAYASGQGRTNADPVIVTLPDRTPNGVELSSQDAGETVRIDIDADADAAIAGGEDIVVELPKFGLPSSIDESDVLIDSDGYSGNPSDVTVSGSKITIEVPTREATSGGSMRTSIPADSDYSIKLKQGAGITNPAAAGSQTVTITDADGDEKYPVTIEHVVKLSAASVTRGDDLKLTINGYANGTATVSIGGTEVGQVEVEDNTAEFPIDTSASAVKAGTKGNKVTVVDSEGSDDGDASATFTIKPKVAVDPESTTPSKEVTIELSDWPSNRSIDTVKIGNTKEIKVSNTSTDADGEASFKVMVPRNVNTGTQTVSVTGGKTTASTTIGINVLMLSVSPASAVPGQQVTISGSGFAKNTKVAENGFKIGGNVVDPGSDATSTSSGNISITVVLPLDVGSGTKMVKLEIAGRDGEGELTVPKPSIELTPAESVPGSVISVTGSNFAANERVEVSFAGAIEEIGRADGNGSVSVRLDIPSGAGVGSTNPVMVKVRPSDTEKYKDLNISAKADHKTPGPAITVSAEARVGGHITISGTNFESFSPLTTVLVGGLDAKPSPAPETDKNGAFEFQARVPRLSAGSHTVTIRDRNNNSATESFEVVTTPIVSTPEEVFGGLIEAGVLGSVWRYSIDATGSDWDSYDPQYADQPGINDLAFVARGDIVWIRVTENVMFQGATLYAGWNLRTLE